jgi:fibronectin-binding autotransporter adhesin
MHTPTMLTRRSARIAALLSLAGAASALGVDAYWIGPDGNWSVGTNWSTGTAPNNNGVTYDVYINGDDIVDRVVTLNQYAAIDALYISDGDQLAFSNGSDLTIRQGVVSNDGVILLDGISSSTDLRFDGGSNTLSGDGEVVMSGTYARIIGFNDATLTQAAGHTIRGWGSLGLDSLGITNLGEILADSTDHTLIIDPSADGMTNSGLLRATNGGRLELGTGVYDNTGGTIEALADSYVRIGAAQLTGGTLQTSGDGYMLFVSSAARLEDVTNEGDLRLDNGDDPALRGTFTNNGSVSTLATGSGTFLQVDGAVTFDGTGMMTFRDTSLNGISGLAGGLPDDAFTNSAGHTIEGGGNIGNNTAGIANEGLINANDGLTMRINPSGLGLTNTGTLRASEGATLTLQDGTYDNTGGTVEALAASGVRIEGGAHITGGTISTEDDGYVRFMAANTSIDSLSLEGNFEIANSADPIFRGTIENNGTIESLATGSGTYIEIDGEVELTGAGTIDFAPVSVNGLQGWAGSGVDDLLTNGPNHTIMGGGRVGIGTCDFINHGTIEANDGTMTLEPQDSLVNTGDLAASNGATLVLMGADFTNTGGTITAEAGSLIKFGAGAHVTGGTLDTESDGAIRLDASTSSIADLTTNGRLEVANGADPTFRGTIENNGEIISLATGSGTYLHADGVATFTGNGTLTLADTTINRLDGLPGGENQRFINGVNHTIRGGGGIGADAADLTNLGLINATVNTPITINPDAGGVLNQGTIRASGSGGVVLTDGDFDNQGAIEVMTGSIAQTTASANLLNLAVPGTIQGGAWRVYAGDGVATLDLGGDPLTVNDAEIVLSGAGATFVEIDTLTSNLGTFRIEQGRDFTTVDAFDNAGRVEVGADTALTLTGDYTQTDGVTLVDGTVTPLGAFDVIGGTLAGSGTVAGSVNLAGGTVAPGSSAGLLTIDGDLVFNGAATLAVEVFDISTFDVLAVTGAATLDGTLSVDFDDEYEPTFGDEFEVMTFGSLGGIFDQFEGLEVGPGLFVSPVYHDFDLTLWVGVIGDVDIDGDVDLADLGALLAAFDSMDGDPLFDPDADFNDDGWINLADLGTLLANYGFGTRGVVPLPSTLALFGTATLVMTRRRSR